MARQSAALTSLCFVLAIAGPVSAQSLADVAKKEQSRRKAAPPPQKTYTDEDLVAGRPPGWSPPVADEGATKAGEAGSPGPSAADRDAAAAATAEQSEAYWRGRFASARAAIIAAEDRLKRWERIGNRARSNGGTVDLRDCSAKVAAGKPGDMVRASTCAPTDKSLIGELDAARAGVAKAQKALVDLESEARRKGALPAWMR